MLYKINSLTSQPSKWFVSLQQADFEKTAKSGALANTEHSAMLCRASEADQKAQPWRYPAMNCGQVSTDSKSQDQRRTVTTELAILCTEVRWSEVKILGEMCVLSLIYSYVAICRFCAICCLIMICFSLLLYNYSTQVFLIFFYVCFLFCVFCVVLFCVLFLLLYIAVSLLFLYKFTNHWHRVETNCSKQTSHHIITKGTEPIFEVKPTAQQIVTLTLR